MSKRADFVADGAEPYAIIDDSDDVLVRVRAVGPLTETAYRRHLEAFREVLEGREGPFGLILHQGRLSSFPTRYIRMTTAWVSEAERRFSSQWVATAYVITNPLLRGAVRVLFWSARSSVPVKCFETSDEAEAWVRRRVAEGQP